MKVPIARDGNVEEVPLAGRGKVLNVSIALDEKVLKIIMYSSTGVKNAETGERFPPLIQIT